MLQSSSLLSLMTAHFIWVVMLYIALTVVRAPAVWGVGKGSTAARAFKQIEPRISANLSNQFELPLFFHVACVAFMFYGGLRSPAVLTLAWVFIGGRVLHSAVQILTGNVRLRGLVFTINFLAVFGLWFLLLRQAVRVGG